MRSRFALRRRLLDIYQRLYAHYGPQHWWPGESAFEVVVGAILTQSAAWANVEKAIANLKAAGVMSVEGLFAIPEAELAHLVYPAGYYNAKARKLKALAAMLFQRFDGNLERLLVLPLPELRRLLLETYGIGPETADSIILYAAGQPIFVVDAYTRRILPRLGLQPQRDDYGDWQALFGEHLPPDAALFNEYHALLVRHGKTLCRKDPICLPCPLLDICPRGKVRVGE